MYNYVDLCQKTNCNTIYNVFSVFFLIHQYCVISKCKIGFDKLILIKIIFYQNFGLHASTRTNLLASSMSFSFINNIKTVKEKIGEGCIVEK